MCCCRSPPLDAPNSFFFSTRSFWFGSNCTPSERHRHQLKVFTMETRLASTSKGVLRAASSTQWSTAKLSHSAALLHTSSRRSAGKQPEVSGNAGLSWDECEPVPYYFLRGNSADGCYGFA